LGQSIDEMHGVSEMTTSQVADGSGQFGSCTARCIVRTDIAPFVFSFHPKRRGHFRILQQIKGTRLLGPNSGNRLGYIRLNYQYQPFPRLLSVLE
jgi:hypothetical protein